MVSWAAMSTAKGHWLSCTAAARAGPNSALRPLPGLASRDGQALWLLQAVCGCALLHNDGGKLQRVPASMSAAAGVVENRVQNLVVTLDKVKFFLEQPGACSTMMNQAGLRRNTPVAAVCSSRASSIWQVLCLPCLLLEPQVTCCSYLAGSTSCSPHQRGLPFPCCCRAAGRASSAPSD